MNKWNNEKIDKRINEYMYTWLYVQMKNAKVNTLINAWMHKLTK